MSYRIFRVGFSALAMLLLIYAPAYAAEFSVLWPQENLLTATPAVHLVVKINPGTTDSLRLTFNQESPVTVSLKEEALQKTYKGLLHKTIFLVKGENTIKVEALAAGKVLEQKDLKVVFKNIRQKDVVVPAGFAGKDFHRPAYEAGCAGSGCHIMESKDSDKKPMPASASTCYSCHSDKSKVLYLHGPVGTFQCLACHHPQEPQQKYRVVARDAELCYRCHELKEKEFKKQFLHGPLGTGKCELCHDPHGSNYPYWLFAKVNDVCYNCHGKGFAHHPIVNHPTENRRDPARKGKTLSCTSCHDPHASTNRVFLSLAPDYVGTCRKCHRM